MFWVRSDYTEPKMLLQFTFFIKNFNVFLIFSYTSKSASSNWLTSLKISMISVS